MKISGARFYRYSLPLVRPLPIRDQVIETREGIIVLIETDDGVTGIGEIAPLPGFSDTSLPDARDIAAHCVRNLMRRENILQSHPPALRDRESFPPSVRFGIECALLHLCANAHSKTPAQILAEEPSAHLPVNALLSGDRRAVLEQAEQAADKGFRVVKCKVGRERMEEEVVTVKELRNVLSPDIAIRLDANRAWRYDDALTFARAISNLNVSYIEEPLAEPERLAEFGSVSPVPYAVDETLQEVGWARMFKWRESGYLDALSDEPGDAEPMLRAVRAAHTWVVKPTLAGFPLRYVTHLLDGFRRIDADLVISSSFESAVGHCALIAIAASAGRDALAAGLDTADWFAENAFTLPVAVNGAIDVEASQASLLAFDARTLEELPND